MDTCKRQIIQTISSFITTKVEKIVTYSKGSKIRFRDGTHIGRSRSWALH